MNHPIHRVIADQFEGASKAPASQPPSPFVAVQLQRHQWARAAAAMRDRFGSVQELDVHLTSLLQLRATMLLQGFEAPLHRTPAWIDTIALQLSSQITAGAHIRIAEALSRVIAEPDPTAWPPLETTHGSLSDGYAHG